MSSLNGCSTRAATLVQWSRAQAPPASLPTNTPATAISYAFDGTGAFATVAASDLGAALDLVDAQLGCLGNPCDAVDGQILAGLAAGGGMGLVNFSSYMLTQLGNFLSDGQILIGTAAGASATNLCGEVSNCLLGNATNGEYLRNTAGGITSSSAADIVNSGIATATALCPAVFDCLDGNSGNGDFFINQGGTVTNTNFQAAVQALIPASSSFTCADVQDCIDAALGAGEIYLGGTPTALCPEVLSCLDALTATGEFLYDDGTGLAATDFATAVNAVAGGGGGGSTTWAGLTDTSGNVGTNGQIIQNLSGTLTPVNVSSAINSQYGNPATGQLLSESGWTDAPNFIDLDDTPATYAGNAGSLLKVNQATNALEFTNLFSDYLALSLSGSQVFSAGSVRTVGLNSQIDQQGSVGNTGSTINVPEQGVYLIVWQAEFTGLVSGPDLIDSKYQINIGAGADVIVVKRDRQNADQATQNFPYAGSGSLFKGLTANTTVSLETEVISNVGTAHTFTITNAHLAVYRVA